METYPIMIDEELAGKLTVDKQGGRTVFDAECRLLPGVVRISVYGGGKEGYLGVLAPEDGKLRLHRALSRSQMRDFPAEIASAERAGLDRGAEPPQEQETEQTQGAGSPHGIAPDAPAAAPEAEPPGDAEAKTPGAAEMPGDMETPEAAEGLSWYSSPDGALVCFDGEHHLIALPLGDARIPADTAGEKRTVEGREYLVFRTKDGRIVRET